MEIFYHLSNSWLGKIMMSESSNLHMKILSQHQRIFFYIGIPINPVNEEKIGNLLYIGDDKVASFTSYFTYNYWSYFIVYITNNHPWCG